MDRSGLGNTSVKESAMAKYMVFYNTTAAMRDQMAQIPPEQSGAGMQDWMAWGYVGWSGRPCSPIIPTLFC